jgi:hypothetical protein
MDEVTIELVADQGDFIRHVVAADFGVVGCKCVTIDDVTAQP